MEQNQPANQQEPSWITTWAHYMVQQYLPEAADPQAQEMMELLLESASQGDSCVPVAAAQITSLKTLVVKAKQITENTVQNAAPLVFDQDKLYLYRYWRLEQRLAQQIGRLMQQPLASVDIRAYQNLLEDQHQRAALQMVAKQALNIVTGGPGTGKTYTLARMIAVLNQAIPNLRIAMAAPTGKAAQRMQEALQNSFLDDKFQQFGLQIDQLKQQKTQTIHRLLGLGFNQSPRFHQQQPLPYDIVVIDEASMLDLNLATLLLEAIPANCRLILLGDANQLASVDVGAVLADLQQVPALAQNRVNLLTSRRFHADALIGKLARFIQAEHHQAGDAQALLESFQQKVTAPSELKKIIISKGMDDVLALEYLPDDKSQSMDLAAYHDKLMWGYQAYVTALQTYLKQAEAVAEEVLDVVAAFDQYRILTATRHGAFGVERINTYANQWMLRQLQQFAAGDWYVGRPVMMTYNDYQLGLSNGDIGICFKHRTQPNQFEVYFPSLNQWIAAARLPKNIQTAFALTIHKSQGSEFNHAAIVLETSAEKLLSQELLYTAVTRAKNAVSLLVQPQALAQALQVRTTRKSGLSNKINSILEN